MQKLEWLRKFHFRCNINIQMDNFSGKVTMGECVVIPAGTMHGFQADEAARFIVADIPTLPKPLQRHQFVKACRLAIESDGQITVAEGELYRVIACFLEVPEPPLTVTL
jgi:hypothetical protein